MQGLGRSGPERRCGYDYGDAVPGGGSSTGTRTLRRAGLRRSSLR